MIRFPMSYCPGLGSVRLPLDIWVLALEQVLKISFSFSFDYRANH